jgi:F0F1-type ATP synthase membrane subunit a
LEVFVGFIQAFVFAVLTLVFMTIATTAHGAGEHETSH